MSNLAFTYEELTKRDKVNPDIFWLKDNTLEEPDCKATKPPRSVLINKVSSPTSKRPMIWLLGKAGQFA